VAKLADYYGIPGADGEINTARLDATEESTASAAAEDPSDRKEGVHSDTPRTNEMAAYASAPGLRQDRL
jgi:hypothetical protein